MGVFFKVLADGPSEKAALPECRQGVRSGLGYSLKLVLDKLPAFRECGFFRLRLWRAGDRDRPGEENAVFEFAYTECKLKK